MSRLDSYLAFIQEAELLKGVLRSATQSSGRAESTAEHSWRLALFASVMLEEFPELDSQRCLMMCLLHDMGELYEGDIPAIYHPDAAQKLESEFRAVEQVFSLLPPKIKEKYMGIWSEYNDCSSKEAQFVKALDKAETIIQHNQGKNLAGFDYRFNLTYGSEYFQGNELFVELRKKLDAETRRRAEESESE